MKPYQTGSFLHRTSNRRHNPPVSYPVNEYLKPACSPNPRVIVTTAEILRDALSKPEGQWHNGDHARIARILRRRGYANRRVQDDGAKRRVWVQEQKP